LVTYVKAVQLLDRYGIGPLFRPLVRCLREQRNYIRRVSHSFRRRSAIKKYFDKNPSRKLHLGASDKYIPGWLNTDLDPPSKNVVFLDCTKLFPFADESFDFVYSEHFIEHIDMNGASLCLAECFRCLKRGGVFRIATPDLGRYLKLFTQPAGSSESVFLEQFRCLYKLEQITPCRALNLLMYNWGHQFLYTDGELISALHRAGFQDVKRSPVGESNYEGLRNIEQHGLFYGDEMNKYETMVFEAVKESKLTTSFTDVAGDAF
jgi:predicted SAM-dependent methyltransferase